MYNLLFSGTLGETLTISNILIITGSALFLGLFVSAVYMLTHKKEAYTVGFTITLIMLPAIIAMIILLVGSNVARAFSLAGAFSLIRFRSAPGDSKDISYVFFTLGVGLACGMGYIGYGAIFALVLSLVMVILTKVNFGRRRNAVMQLRITMPEDTDYNGLFDDILEQYAPGSRLVRIKTSEFGSLFELTYDVMMKDVTRSKQFIDKLRCKNGNLNIVLSMKSMNEGAMF